MTHSETQDHAASPAPTPGEQEQARRANASGRRPVVFVHGLWLLPASWARWAELFEAEGFAVLTPGWPDDPETSAEARAHPEALARKSISRVADHLAAVVALLDRRPVLIGHSFGGLLAQVLAGRGLSAATVAIDPAAFQGVLPLPFSALRSAWPVLKDPLNIQRAVPLTFEQFRFAFANALEDAEARELFDAYVVPGAGEPLFQAAAANLNPWTEGTGPHRSARGGRSGLSPAAAKPRHHGVPRDPGPRALAYD